MNHNNRMCLWKIIAPRGRRITIEFLDFDLNPASAVYGQSLNFLDGMMTEPFESFNGKSTPKAVKSSSNKLWIYFDGSSLSSHRGFKLKFTSDEPSSKFPFF